MASDKIASQVKPVDPQRLLFGQPLESMPVTDNRLSPSVEPGQVLGARRSVAQRLANLPVDNSNSDFTENVLVPKLVDLFAVPDDLREEGIAAFINILKAEKSKRLGLEIPIQEMLLDLFEEEELPKEAKSVVTELILRSTEYSNIMCAGILSSNDELRDLFIDSVNRHSLNDKVATRNLLENFFVLTHGSSDLGSQIKIKDFVQGLLRIKSADEIKHTIFELIAEHKDYMSEFCDRYRQSQESDLTLVEEGGLSDRVFEERMQSCAMIIENLQELAFTLFKEPEPRKSLKAIDIKDYINSFSYDHELVSFLLSQENEDFRLADLVKESLFSRSLDWFDAQFKSRHLKVSLKQPYLESLRTFINKSSDFVLPKSEFIVRAFTSLARQDKESAIKVADSILDRYQGCYIGKELHDKLFNFLFLHSPVRLVKVCSKEQNLDDNLPRANLFKVFAAAKSADNGSRESEFLRNLLSKYPKIQIAKIIASLEDTIDKFICNHYSVELETGDAYNIIAANFDHNNLSDPLAARFIEYLEKLEPLELARLAERFTKGPFSDYLESLVKMHKPGFEIGFQEEVGD